MNQLSPAQTIVLYQPTLYAIALKFLKSKADAEDVVQETFMRWLNTEREKIQNTRAYLIRAVTNNCITHLQSIKRKKEEYLQAFHWDEWVEKFKETDLSAEVDARLGKAFHIIQHRLEPLERAVYVLKEAFDFDYKSLQVILNKKQDHCRQLFCRARRKVVEERDKINSVIGEKTALLKSFINSCDLGRADDFIDEVKKVLGNKASNTPA